MWGQAWNTAYIDAYAPGFVCFKYIRRFEADKVRRDYVELSLVDKLTGFKKPLMPFGLSEIKNCRPYQLQCVFLIYFLLFNPMEN